MSDYKRLTHKNGNRIEEYCEVGHCKYADFRVCKLKGIEHNVDEDCIPAMIERLAELEDKIEQGTLIECNPKLIGECIVGIHQYTDGTYAMDLDEENIVIGFCSDGIVTANTTHAYNDYFKHGLYFIDDEKGRAEATKKLKELQNG